MNGTLLTRAAYERRSPRIGTWLLGIALTLMLSPAWADEPPMKVEEPPMKVEEPPSPLAQPEAQEPKEQEPATDQEPESRESKNWFTEWLTRRSSTSNQRNHASVLNAFRDTIQPARKSTVRVFSDQKSAALGMIVNPDGYVLTKASEISQPIHCELLDGRRLPAKLVGVAQSHDLAMLKLEANELPAVEWAAEPDFSPGSWIVTSGLGELPQAIGVISVAPRWIRGGVLGVYLTEAEDAGAQIADVNRRGGGARAGLKPGDIIVAVNDRPVQTVEEAIQAVGSYLPGENVKVEIERDDVTMILTARLDSINESFGNRRAIFQNNLGGPLSERRAGFPNAVQHDSSLPPADCGGPVVDLSGKVIGINIARSGRVSTLALPASEVLPLLEDLMTGKLPPPPDPEKAKRLQALAKKLAQLEKRLTQATDNLKKAQAELDDARQAAQETPDSDALQQALLTAAKSQKTAKASVDKLTGEIERVKENRDQLNE